MELTEFINILLLSCFAIYISSGINRICEYVVNGRVSWRRPEYLFMTLQGKPQSLGAKPEPHFSRGPQLRETIEYGADGAPDLFVRMKQYFPILFAPNKSYWQSAAQFAPSGFVANAAFQPRP